LVSLGFSRSARPPLRLGVISQTSEGRNPTSYEPNRLSPGPQLSNRLPGCISPKFPTLLLNLHFHPFSLPGCRLQSLLFDFKLEKSPSSPPHDPTLSQFRFLNLSPSAFTNPLIREKRRHPPPLTIQPFSLSFSPLAKGLALPLCHPFKVGVPPSLVAPPHACRDGTNDDQPFPFYNNNS